LPSPRPLESRTSVVAGAVSTADKG
jgi:hypothetical protein